MGNLPTLSLPLSKDSSSTPKESMTRTLRYQSWASSVTLGKVPWPGKPYSGSVGSGMPKESCWVELVAGTVAPAVAEVEPLDSDFLDLYLNFMLPVLEVDLRPVTGRNAGMAGRGPVGGAVGGADREAAGAASRETFPVGFGESGGEISRKTSPVPRVEATGVTLGVMGGVVVGEAAGEG
jgi:hypothetical protein